MGLHRIVIDAYTYEQAAAGVAKVAVEAAKLAGVSVSEAKVVSHPGQEDEQTIEVYKA